ncbi:aspartate:alanine exchanger family transporter [Corynebacterium sphenisci]|uniref:aspartate:alanine exchanger family transporter n=1 Tax=Corynebacterium sphenisci TaxID=191493 RepID=UPI0026E03957|nr:aspartate:alanine exchanger family transporter [Corynebacterium sphenisci]MDO5730090.1 aspartate:alanine exchanger family transporter [Corynebacterium sphenisci]
MLGYLASAPLLALSLILALGFAVGRIRIGGLSLGSAAILFVAIGVSAAEPGIRMPPLLYHLGLALFVYCIGLAAGPAFFRALRSRGLALNLVLVGVLAALTGLAAVLIRAAGADPITGAGMFAGAVSSTPGMAAILDAVPELLPAGADPARAAEAVVGYSLAYPGGVLGVILVAAVGYRLLKVDHQADARAAGVLPEPLHYACIRIGPGRDLTVAEVPDYTGARVITTRLALGEGPGADQRLAEPGDRLRPGRVIMVNGTAAAIETATAALGERSEMALDAADLRYVRMAVSNPEVAGRTIAELRTLEEHGFTIARLRRGDADVVPTGADRLQLADRVRVVAPRQRIDAIRDYLGDSEKSLANPDLLPLALGLALGLGLGAIPIPLPGGATLSLGFGGGPILAGLVLGALGRTGPVRWQLPYHATRTLEAAGMALFMAGVGTSAGAGFREALTDPASLRYIGLGLVLTVVAAVAVVAAAMAWRGLSFDEAIGVAAGLSTNPAVIAYLDSASGTDLSARGYTTVYPVAMVGKILAAQGLIMLLL